MGTADDRAVASTIEQAGTEPAPTASGVPGLHPPRQRGRSSRLIGEIVTDLGYASRDQVERAVESARRDARLTGQVLIEEGLLTPDQLAQVLAERFGIERVDLSVYPVDLSAVRAVGPEFVRRYESVPIGYDEGGRLLLAMAEPSNLLAVDDVTMLTGRHVRQVVASYDDIRRLVVRVGATDWPEVEAADPEPVGAPEPADVSGRRDVSRVGVSADDGPVVRLVDSIMARAVQRGASDIHFDPGADDMQVQFRVDGVMAAAVTVPQRMVAGVVSRLKVMAELDIAERRAPQDGRTGVIVEDRPVDMRVVTLPVVHGEAVVVRLLDGSIAPAGLADLGLQEPSLGALTTAMERAMGGILVTGPTGSGKSTTLYAVLSQLNTGSETIVTIEDPVEYRLDGVKQMGVNPKAGVTFASGLRSIMRADPDVIMIGEIRDRETAQISVEAALTGHMVLSTLHTRDAANAMTRLLEMGVEPFLLSSAIDCVVAQRLARRLCDACKREELMPAEVLLDHGWQVDDDLVTYHPGSCQKCAHTGFQGRVGIFEVLSLTEELRKLVLARVSGDVLAEAATAAGMRRLRDDGLEKIVKGITSPAEVARVTSVA